MGKSKNKIYKLLRKACWTLAKKHSSTEVEVCLIGVTDTDDAEYVEVHHNFVGHKELARLMLRVFVNETVKAKMSSTDVNAMIEDEMKAVAERGEAIVEKSEQLH